MRPLRYVDIYHPASADKSEDPIDGDTDRDMEDYIWLYMAIDAYTRVYRGIYGHIHPNMCILAVCSCTLTI